MTKTPIKLISFRDHATSSKLMIKAITGIMLVIASLSAAASNPAYDYDFINHGVAVGGAWSRGAAAVLDEADNRIVSVWLQDRRGCHSMLIINAETGETDQIEFKRSGNDVPYTVFLSSRNRWYTQFGKYFYEFDTATRQFSFIGETPEGLGMCMVETEDGTIWMGTYPNCHLFSFNPETGKLVNHGVLNEETWAQYPGTIVYDDKGWIYIGISYMEAQLLGYNPETGEIRKYIPDEARKVGHGRVRRGTDGKVYIRGEGGESDFGWHIAEGGEITPVESPHDDFERQKVGASWRTLFGEFPDGSEVVELQTHERSMTIRDADGTTRKVAFDYESKGISIFSIHLGPDGDIYGATRSYTFRYHPEEDRFYVSAPFTMGHMNTMANQQGKLFGAMYASGDIYAYDINTPRSDWHTYTPEQVGRSAYPTLMRPHAMISHPDGKHIITSGTPGYGRVGGGLYIYNIEGEAEILTHEDMLKHHSTFALIALPDGNLIGGTTVQAGTGGEKQTDEAELYIFDFSKRKVVWRDVIMPDTWRIRDLALGPEGFVYGVTEGSHFFVFDPETRKVLHRENLEPIYGSVAGAHQVARCMKFGPDNNLYMLFRNAIVRIQPDSFEHTKLVEPPVRITTGILFIEDRLYFVHGSELWSCRIRDIMPRRRRRFLWFKW